MKVSDKIKELTARAQRVSFTQAQLDDCKGYVTLQIHTEDDWFELSFLKYLIQNDCMKPCGSLGVFGYADTLVEALKLLEEDLHEYELGIEDSPAEFIESNGHTYQLVD